MTERLQALTRQPIQQRFPWHKRRAGCPALPAVDDGPAGILHLPQVGCSERVPVGSARREGAELAWRTVERSQGEEV